MIKLRQGYRLSQIGSGEIGDAQIGTAVGYQRQFQRFRHRLLIAIEIEGSHGIQRRAVRRPVGRNLQPDLFWAPGRYIMYYLPNKTIGMYAVVTRLSAVTSTTSRLVVSTSSPAVISYSAST